MGMLWHGYFAIERFPANLNEDNWATLINEIRQIVGVGGDPPYCLTERGDLDTFVYVVDDPETEEVEEVEHSNIYFYEARFRKGAIDFAKFRNRLITIFDVNPVQVTYTTGTVTIRDRPSCFATYKYKDKNRIRVGLLGCASDSELCTWAESRIECDGYLLIAPSAWELNNV